jgi:phosphatidylserine/phosphatidylglycerophosphate/cardiolipin synthase-like enzyme
MDGARVRLARLVGAADRLDRFRVYVPVTEGGEDIYVHAKISIVDDRFLRVGSANMNNRSLGLDSECDLAIDCALPANRKCGPAITALRERLMAEHLGCDATDVARVFAATGSLVATIDRLTRTGRTLELLDLEKPGPLDAFIADNQLLDPERPEGILEPLSRRSIWSGWRGGRERLQRRMRLMRRRPG